MNANKGSVTIMSTSSKSQLSLTGDGVYNMTYIGY